MAHEVVIFGCIEGPGAGPAGQRLHERNAEVIASLPVEDDWPALARGMFALPNPRPWGTFHTQVIHFGGSFKDSPSVRETWDEWLEKFEALLARMFWVAASVFIDTEFEGQRLFQWVAAPSAIERMFAEPQHCVDLWERTCVTIGPTQDASGS